MLFGIVLGIFIANAAIAIGVVANARENRNAKDIARKMLFGGIAVFSLSVIFAVA